MLIKKHLAGPAYYQLNMTTCCTNILCVRLVAVMCGQEQLGGKKRRRYTLWKTAIVWQEQSRKGNCLGSEKLYSVILGSFWFPPEYSAFWEVLLGASALLQR